MENVTDIADSLVDSVIVEADAQARKRISQDILTEGTDGMADSYYDVDEMIKSKTKGNSLLMRLYN